MVSATNIMLLPVEKRSYTVLQKTGVKISSEFPFYPLEELKQKSVVIINKPKGPTSHQVSGYVKEIIGAKTTGHSGTLDPLVTGVLPICIDDATKIIQALLPAGKEYVCFMRIHQPISEQKIKDTLKQFVGTITQLPPVKSAVKREERQRTIYYIENVTIQGQDILYTVGCQAGTYIRKLCDDIGKALGCGAHMQQLVRTKVAYHKYIQCVTLQTLIDAVATAKEGDETQLRQILIPLNQAIEHIPKIWIDNGAIYPLCHGAQLYASGIISLHSDIQKGDLVALFSKKNELVALATSLHDAEQLLKAKKDVAAKTLRVILPETQYPKVS